MDYGAILNDDLIVTVCLHLRTELFMDEHPNVCVKFRDMAILQKRREKRSRWVFTLICYEQRDTISFVTINDNLH